MANYMWLVATKNQEEFRDPDRLITILSEKIPNLSFTKEEFDRDLYIICKDKKRNGVDFWIQPNVNFETFMDQMGGRDEAIEILDKEGQHNLADELIMFLDHTEPDMRNSLFTKHYMDHRIENIQESVLNFLRSDYFQCYIFYEGIYPEFEKPLKGPKKKKSVIDRFKDFMKKRTG
jgi:hypothetical protein